MYQPVEITEQQQLIDLILLWKNVFADSIDYVKTFYKYFYHDMDIAAVQDKDGKIASACHFLPVSMKMRGVFCTGSYLYAAMTAEAHRSQGLMHDLLRQQMNKAYARGDAFMCTLPASEDLYTYYAKLGFAPVFTLDVVKLNRNHLSKLKLTLSFDSHLSPEFAYRKSFGVREYTIVKTKRFVDYTELEHRNSGGVFIPLYGGYLYVQEKGNQVFVREAYITNENLPYIASVLLKKYPNCDDFVFQICPKSAFANHPSQSIPAGSIRLIHGENVLRLFALKNPSKTLELNWQDPLIPENDGLYKVTQGKVTKEPFSTEIPAISVEALSDLVFTNFKDMVPYMNMMLD